MEERYPLAGGRGWLSVREDGGSAVCEAQLPDDGRGLYKVYLKGDGGRHLLGTLLPTGGRLHLRRVLPLEPLRREGMWPPTGGTAELAFAAGTGGAPTPPPEGWTRERAPGKLMGDRLLAWSAGELPGALVRRTEEGFLLALPWGERQAFGLTPLFCLARLETLGERQYAIFEFNSRGCPVCTHNEKGKGKANSVKPLKE